MLRDARLLFVLDFAILTYVQLLHVLELGNVDREQLPKCSSLKVWHYIDPLLVVR